MKIDVISASNAPQAIGPYSQATRAGQFIFCAGQAGFDPATMKLVDGGIREQTAQTLRNIDAILKSAGSSLRRVVKVTVFLHDWKYFKEVNEVFGEFFKENPPARSTVQGSRYPEGSLVAIEAIAVTDEDA
jgi:2-iminobutanoate/2-iminopropanoate deaminase